MSLQLAILWLSRGIVGLSFNQSLQACLRAPIKLRGNYNHVQIFSLSSRVQNTTQNYVTFIQIMGNRQQESRARRY